MAKQILTGKVVSTKMQNTIVVEIERRISHPMYRKFIKIHKKFKADTGGKEYQVGDIVSIEETRPISRDKHFKVLEKKGEAE